MSPEPADLSQAASEGAPVSDWRRTISESNSWFLVAAVLIGALTALANVAFHWAIDGAHDVFWVHLGGAIGIGRQSATDDIFQTGLAGIPSRWWLIPLIPMAGMLAIVILDRWFPGEMKGYGLPRFLEIVNFRGGYLRRRWITLKTLSSAITLGSGMSAGIEGPIAQIGGSIGSTVGRGLRPSFSRLRILVACGAASAVSATFGSPIGGVFFAQEIVLIGEFHAESLALIVLAAGTAVAVSEYLKASHPIIAAPEFDFQVNHEVMFYVLMGMLCGLLAVFFIRSFYRIRDYFAESRIPPTYQPLVGGMIVGVTLIFFPQVSSSGYATMNEALNGTMGAALLLSLVFVKIIMTGVTLGCGGAGGVFAPSMFIGTVFGGGFAKLINIVLPGTIASPHGFALIGMGAFLAAATHAPLTAIFLLVEMTRDYNVVIPIMITAVSATLVSRRMMPESIDTYDLAQRGLDVHAGSEANILRSLYVRGLVRKEYRAIPESMAVTDFVRYLTNSPHMYFPVVNKDGDLSGVVSMGDLRGVLMERDAWPFLVVGELANRDVVTVTGSDTLYEAMKLLTGSGLQQLVVVDEENPGKVVGMLSLVDLQSFYQKRLLAREIHG